MGLPDSVDDPDKNDLFSSNSTPVIHNHQNHSSDDSDQDTNRGDQYNGYAPLGHDGGANYQNQINDGDDSDDDETMDVELQTGDDDLGGCGNSGNGIPDVVSPETEIECEVWNAPRPNELNIELDSTKTEQILSAMAGISLPNAAIPPWAIGIPEEKWKEDLLVKIREKSTTSSGASYITPPN